MSDVGQNIRRGSKGGSKGGSKFQRWVRSWVILAEVGQRCRFERT